MKNLSKKQVRETSAGKSISAYVILKDGKHIATVQSYYANSGNVMVDVWDNHTIVYQGKAGGYGYDKFVSALNGAEIDGVKLTDHSSIQDNGELAEIMFAYDSGKLSLKSAEAKAKKIGAQFANWNNDKKKYTSLFYEGGLDRLKTMGYDVIQAI